jgi:hypothetical protein
MSYSFKVEAKDGVLTIACAAPQYVPDGQYTVGGHQDNTGNRSLSLIQCMPNGTIAAQLSTAYTVPATPEAAS